MSNQDQAFLNKLTEITEANLNNEKFGVSELTHELGMSRSNIHRRLKACSNLSVSQFINKVRLEKAMVLLQENVLSAAEIAYIVGFSSPAYFSRCFHKYYGFPPGEVKKRRVDEVPTSKDFAGEVIDEDDKCLNGDIKTNLKSKKAIFRKVIPVLVFLLVVLMTFKYFYNNNNLSIIVLPFENFSNNIECESFAEGIREDILNDLHKITGLRVISRTSADQFKNSELSAREIAKKMKVKYVLEGSVRLYDDKLRISTQLIDAFPFREDHVWSDNFDRKLDDYIGVQDEIALKVASSVKISLSESEIQQIQKISTKNSKAYNYYLQARFLLHKGNSPQRSDFNKDGVLNCIKYYELAIAEDNNFVEAYAGLANAWLKLSAWKFIASNEGFLKGREYSLKALELDPDCAEAHYVLGTFLIWGQRKLEEGGEQLKKSIRLNPNFASTRQVYAQYLMITGPIEEARIHINRALELEPYFWVILNLNSWIYYFEEKYAEALEACTVARDYNPDFSSNEWLFVLNYAKLGEGEKMKQELQNIAKRYSATDDYSIDIQNAYNESGINGLFLWMIDVNKNNPINTQGLNGHPFFLAWWNAVSGNREEAIYWLEKNMERKNRLYVYFNLIATNPDFDILRDDPRFLKIVDDIGLTAYHDRKAN